MGSEDTRIRGTALEGSEQKDAADHVAYEKKRKPDSEVHVDDEVDSLYNDGLDIEADSEQLADTHASKRPK